MDSCILCSNTTQSKVDRIITYHSFPKEPRRKMMWLKILKLENFSDNHRVCSDHFAPKDFRPGRKHIYTFAVPKISLEPINSEKVNKTIKLRDGTAIQGSPNLLSPRRTSRKLKPVKHKDYSTYQPKIKREREEIIANGNRCSAWNCPNKYPMPNMSFFGYPSEYERKKIWIKNCGIENLVGPYENVKASLKVCTMHFSEDMFRNTNKKNRLVSKAVPTIFKNCDTPGLYPEDVLGEFPDVNNFVETILNNSFTNNDNGIIIPASSKNDDTRINLLPPTNVMNNELPKRESNMVIQPIQNGSCCVPGCIYPINVDCLNKKKGNPKSMLAIFDTQMEYVNEWSSILGIPLTIESKVCEKHFKPADMISRDIYITGFGLAKEKKLMFGAMPVKKYNVIKRPRVSNINEEMLIKKSKEHSKDSPKTISKLGDESENEKSLIGIVPSIPIRKQPLNCNTGTLESQSNITSNASPTADPQNTLNHILPKILKNNSLHISLEPTAVKQSQPVGAPKSKRTNIIQKNVSSNVVQILPKIIINNSEQKRATQTSEKIKVIGNPNLVKLEPTDNPPIMITIDDFSIDEQIPSMDEFKKIFPNVPGSRIMREFFWLTRDLILPHNFWKCYHDSTNNSVVFIEYNESSQPIKKVFFRNSIVPSIFIHKTPYDYKATVRTKQDLDNLLENINDVKICLGNDGHRSERCIGFFVNTSGGIDLCKNCQISKRNLSIMDIDLKAKLYKIKVLEKRLREQEIRVKNAKIRHLAENKKHNFNQVIFIE